MPPEATPTAAIDDQGPPTGDYSEAFSLIDQIPSGDEGETPSQPSQPAQPRTEPKPAEAKPKPEAAKPDGEKPATPKKEAPKGKSAGEDIDGILSQAAKPADPKPAKPEGEPDTDKLFDDPATPRQLRETYKRTKEELTKAAERIKALESDTTRAKAAEVETIKRDYESRLEASERRRSEMETALRFADYEKSEDFQSKYHTPLREAWTEAMATIEGLTIQGEDGESRPVAPQDIARLMAMSNPQARAAAHEMFGTAGPEIMGIRARLMNLSTSRHKALEEWKAKGSERDAQLAEQRNATVKQWESGIGEFREAHPELFGDRDDDQPGNELIRNSTSLVRKAFLGEGIPEGLTPDQRRAASLEAQTQVAVRAMAYSRTLRDLKTAESEIASLRAKLAEYEDSELPPGHRRDSGGDAGGRGGDGLPEDAIDDLPGFNER